MLLGAAIYIGVIAFIYQLDTAENVPWFFVIVGGWNLVLLVATVIAIVDALRKVRAGRTIQLANDALAVKLASIPFFVLNNVVLAFLFIGGLAILIFGGPVLWLIGTVGIGLTYLTMLSTSVYAWATIARLRRERIIGTGLTVLYTILSLVFFTDIATGVLLFGHSRRRPRLALVWVLLTTGVSLIALAVLGFFFSTVADDFNLDVFFDFDSLGWAPIGLIIFGIGVILATVIVSIARRSALRLEARRATVATETELPA